VPCRKKSFPYSNLHGGVVFITQRKEFSIPSRKLPRV